MAVEYVAPTETENGGVRGGTVITHPAFAQIRASRVSGSALLYGSDFRHQHYITIAITKSELHRDLSRDWEFAREELIEVSMSEAQWATFISTLNSGRGTPCTLDHIQRVSVPQIPYVANRREQFSGELEDTLQIVQDSLSKLTAQIAETKLSEKQKKVLLDSVQAAERNLAPNLSFVANQFGEHMEDTVEKAKVEIEAYTNATIQRVGLTAISAGSPIALISTEAAK